MDAACSVAGARRTLRRIASGRRWGLLRWRFGRAGGERRAGEGGAASEGEERPEAGGGGAGAARSVAGAGERDAAAESREVRCEPGRQTGPSSRISARGEAAVGGVKEAFAPGK